MDSTLAGALAGVAGVVLGTVLGGTGKYWLLRRDAWSEARASGLILLADVRAVREAEPGARVVSDTELGVKSWDSHRQVLAKFRRGNFPNGFQAKEWLELARHFALLKELNSRSQTDELGDWWNSAESELAAAERLLVRFERDPKIFWYVVWATIRR
jgi:hypothetical protein